MLTSKEATDAKIETFTQRQSAQAVQAPQGQGRPDPISSGRASRMTGNSGDTGPYTPSVDGCTVSGGPNRSRLNSGLINVKICQLPGCGLDFTPVSSAKEQRFCSEEHRAMYWKLAANIGDKMIREGRYTILNAPKRRQGAGILDILGCTPNEWVPRNRILGGLWNSRRITDLRAQGHLIEHRMFQGESQYRLVVAE